MCDTQITSSSAVLMSPPEGEGVLLRVDDVSVFASLSVLLFVVHLRVFCVLRACWVGVVPTTHQVQTASPITASLGQHSSLNVTINMNNKVISNLFLSPVYRCVTLLTHWNIYLFIIYIYGFPLGQTVKDEGA